MSLSEKLIELAESGFKVSIEYEPENEAYLIRISKPHYQSSCARVYRYIFANSGNNFDSVFLEALNMAEKTWNDFYKRGES